MSRVSISQRDAYGEALLALGERDEKVLVLTADLSSSTRIDKFARKFPERFFNLGVAEQNAVGAAAGLALEGFIPFLSSFAVFIPGRCFDQIRVSICQNKANVKLVGSHLGFSNSGDGASAQSIADIALMRVLPEMVVLSPADANEVRGAVAAMAAYQGPVYMRMSRSKTRLLTRKGKKFRIGQARIMRRGKKLTIVGTGPILAKALAVANKLNAEVINCSTIKPLDTTTIVESVKKTGRVLILEEHSIFGGLGAAVAESLSQEYPVPLKIIGIPDVFGESARDPEELYQKYGLTEEKIEEEGKKLITN